MAVFPVSSSSAGRLSATCSHRAVVSVASVGEHGPGSAVDLVCINVRDLVGVVGICATPFHARSLGLHGSRHTSPSALTTYAVGWCSKALPAYRRWPVEHPAPLAERRPIGDSIALGGAMSGAARREQAMVPTIVSRPQPVPARAMLRWPNHPRAVCAADQRANSGHRGLWERLVGSHPFR